MKVNGENIGGLDTVNQSFKDRSLRLVTNQVLSRVHPSIVNTYPDTSAEPMALEWAGRTKVHP
jgi:hypothetical protein